MTIRRMAAGLAVIFGLAALFLAWLALASLILAWRQHWLSYVHWPDAAFLWWQTLDDPGLTEASRSAGWFAGEVLVVALFILLGQTLRRWRFRSRLSTMDADGTPRPVERVNDDNLGHSRLMDEKTAREIFPAKRGKLIGMLSNKELLFDECFNTSAVSFEFIRTRGGKSSRACAMLAFWPDALMVFDPAQELAHMTWRMMTGVLGRRVCIMNPDQNPLDENGLLRPWAPFIASTNILGWIDLTHPLAEMHVHAITQLFFEEDDTRVARDNDFFSGTAESLLACIIAHVLWDTGITRPDGTFVPPLPRDLISVQEYLSLPGEDLRAALTYIRKFSPSKLARRYAGPLSGSHPETFSDIHQTCELATRWLSIDALSEMVSGDTFSVTDICHDPSMALFVQIPMSACQAFPNISRVIFGSIMYAKIEDVGETFPLVLTDESWLLKARFVRQVVLNGGKYRIALHQLWQSRGDMDRTWGRETRESFFDSAAWIALGPLGDINAAREVSEACGHYGVMAYSSGDNTNTQVGVSFWGRWSKGQNLNRHPIKRWVFYAHEIMQDLDRNVRLILNLKQPLVVGAAPWFQIKELDGLIDPSPYARERNVRRPWYRLFVRGREVPVPTPAIGSGP